MQSPRSLLVLTSHSSHPTPSQNRRAPHQLACLFIYARPPTFLLPSRSPATFAPGPQNHTRKPLHLIEHDRDLSALACKANKEMLNPNRSQTTESNRIESGNRCEVGPITLHTVHLQKIKKDGDIPTFNQTRPTPSPGHLLPGHYMGLLPEDGSGS